jgi:integrase/recombinase XerD
LTKNDINFKKEHTSKRGKNARRALTFGGKMRDFEEKKITVKDLIELFIDRRKIMRVSPETIKHYKPIFKKFIQFIGEDYTTDKITRYTFLDYTGYLEKKHDNTITINTDLRGVRALLYFGMEEEYISYFKVKLIKEERKIKESYTDEEVKRLLEKPRKSNFKTYRTWVMINFLVATGIRLSTLTNVKIGDLDFLSRKIFLRKTKGQKQYILDMSYELHNILKEYLIYRKGEEEEYLFCTVHGEQLARRRVQQNIAEYNKSRGIKKTSVHLFRHTFARLWIKNGGGLENLQEVLGHSTLEMSKRYVALYSNERAEIYMRFNPLDKLTGDKKTTETHITMKKTKRSNAS